MNFSYVLRDLFINACILITMISITKFYFIQKDLSSKKSFHKITLGIATGLLGIILIGFGIRLPDSTLIDFRNVPLALAAIFGGPVSVLISGTVMSVLILVSFGLSKGAYFIITAILFNTVGCAFLTKFIVSRNMRWIILSAYCTTVYSAFLFFQIHDTYVFTKTAALYLGGILVVTFLLYLYTRYMETSNYLFNKYKKEASIDFLTGLKNVRQYDLILNEALDEVEKTNKQLSMLYIDIDYFKKINDTFGHHEGDIILTQFAQLLLLSSRHDDQVFRNGGEEFSVLLFDSSPDIAFEVAERIRSAVEQHKFKLSTGSFVNITISIGVATYPDNVNNIDWLAEKADTALYQAKRAGRNKVMVAA